MAKTCRFRVELAQQIYGCVNINSPSMDGTCKLCALGDMKGKLVVIEVYGGVADVTSCPEGIKCVIIDHDNDENEFIEETKDTSSSEAPVQE